MGYCQPRNDNFGIKFIPKCCTSVLFHLSTTADPLRYHWPPYEQACKFGHTHVLEFIEILHDFIFSLAYIFLKISAWVSTWVVFSRSSWRCIFGSWARSGSGTVRCLDSCPSVFFTLNLEGFNTYYLFMLIWCIVFLYNLSHLGPGRVQYFENM